MGNFVRKLEFGNYTLKFGDKKVLLDLFEEVVKPSFKKMAYFRNYGDSCSYFFIDTQLVSLSNSDEEPVLGIAGRIVKNTKLRRDQTFTGAALKDDFLEVETAPSSSFLLILNNHRIIFSKEVPGAPTLENFKTTSQQFLKRTHIEYINREYEKSKKEKEDGVIDKKVTKKQLIIDNPSPELRITPLADSQSLQEFVKRFRQINKLSVKLLPTNKEDIDNDGFWSRLDDTKNDMNGKNAKVEFSNNENGLDKGAVLEQAGEASYLGNSELNFSGEDMHGDTLKGSNDDFSLSVEVEDVPKEPAAMAARVYTMFKDLVSKGVIKIPKASNAVTAKIVSLL